MWTEHWRYSPLLRAVHVAHKASVTEGKPPWKRTLLLCGDVEKLNTVVVGHTVMSDDFLSLPNKHACASLGCSVLTLQPFRMDLSLDVAIRCQVCAVFLFLNIKGARRAEINHPLTEAHGQSCMHVKWCRVFTVACTEIHDKERSSRPSISDATVESKSCMGNWPGCILVVAVSQSTIRRIWAEKLQYLKVCVRWVGW